MGSGSILLLAREVIDIRFGLDGSVNHSGARGSSMGLDGLLFIDLTNSSSASVGMVSDNTGVRGSSMGHDGAF